MRIGVVLNVLDEEYQISVYKGIKSKALELGIDLISFQHQNSKFSDDNMITSYTRKDFFNLDGIILLTSVLVDSNFINTKADVQKIWGDVPVVSVGQKVEGIPSFMVQTDDSMKQLVEHLLLHHNYRNFFFIGGSLNHHDAISREQIFTKTMEAYKPWYNDLRYKIKHGWFTEQQAIKAMNEYYDENPDDNPDVVVCANDNMAMGVYKFFKMNQDNPKVKQAAVTGFDDIPQARFELPAYTTIRQPLNAIGTEAMLGLLEVIKGNEIPMETYIESEFIVRDSCGCLITQQKENWQKDYIRKLQKSYVKSEHFLRLVTHIIQNLNYPETFDGLNYVLNESMNQLNVKNFCILIGSNKVTPVFVRREGVFYPDFMDQKQCSYGELYDAFLKMGNQKSISLVSQNLWSGKTLLGSVWFDCEDYQLPYVSTITTSIAQTLVRIESAYEKQRRSEYLEKEVWKRTKELVEANNKRMEVEAEVLNISEMERLRFSTDLHDDICQRLAGISMLCRSYAKQNTPVKITDMAELAELIGDTLQRTRQYAHNSYPVELESLGLKDSIGNLCDSFEKQQNIKCIYNWNIEDTVDFNNIQKLNIFRIIQEALHNVGKHSKAKNVEVSLNQAADKLQITVIDDGNGIPETNDNIKKGMGLKSMEYRANQMNASFSIRANASGGTCVEVVVDLTQQENKNE